MRKKGFTLIELLVVVAIIAMLLAILMPALSRVKKIAQRVVCGTNLKGIGTAQQVYAADFDGIFAVIDAIGKNFDDSEPVYAAANTTQAINWSTGTDDWNDPIVSSFSGKVTVGSSLYLLVKFADTNPKQFVCPASEQAGYRGENTGGNDNTSLDIVELNDFGRYSNDRPKKGQPDNGHNNRHGPKMHVSFSYHMPFTKHRSTGNKTAQFAVMADKNPWMDSLLKPSGIGAINAETYRDLVAMMPNYWDGTAPSREKKLGANAQPHEREGQNVMFGDGHNEYTKVADVGVKFDNIYTYHDTALSGDMRHRRGTNGADYKPQVMHPKKTDELMCPRMSWDSFLVNDDVNDGLIYMNN